MKSSASMANAITQWKIRATNEWRGDVGGQVLPLGLELVHLGGDSRLWCCENSM